MIPREIHRMKTFALALSVTLLLAAPAPAAKVKTWTAYAPAGYDKAQLRQAVVSSEGAVRLARRLKPVAADGRTLFAGTGPHGRVYKITPDDKAVVLFQARQEHILSLARGDNGLLFAGTDKNGLVYRIDAGGTARVLFQAAQPEVRALV